MLNLYLSRPAFDPAWIKPHLPANACVAVMAADEADANTLIAALADVGIAATPLAPFVRPTAYDAVIAAGADAPAMAGLCAAEFHLVLGYTRSEEGDERMQAYAQAVDHPVFAFGENAGLLDVNGELSFFGAINAYYPIMPLESLS